MLYNAIRFPILPSTPPDCLQSSPEIRHFGQNSNQNDEILNIITLVPSSSILVQVLTLLTIQQCFSLADISDCMAMLLFFILFFFLSQYKMWSFLCCLDRDKSQIIHPLAPAALHFIPFLLLLLSYFKSSLETTHDLELL